MVEHVSVMPKALGFSCVCVCVCVCVCFLLFFSLHAGYEAQSLGMVSKNLPLSYILTLHTHTIFFLMRLGFELQACSFSRAL
jgi:hypothetical protein